MFDDSDRLGILWRTVRVARAQQLTFVAAAVAFYAFISLVPVALLGLVVASSVGAGELAASVTESTNDVLTPSAQQLFTEALTEESGRGGATVAGFVGLVWSGSRVLYGLDRAFSQVYGTANVKSAFGTVRDSLVVAAAITLGVLAVVGVEAVLSAAAGVIGLFSPLFLLVTLFAAFLPMYVVFPDVPVDASEAIPGAALAALGWTVLGRAFTLYTSVAGTYALYGALGAVFLVLTWLYVGSLLLVLGAVLNAVLAGRDADRQLQIPGGRHVSTGAMSEDVTGTDDEPGERAGDRESAGESDGASAVGRGTDVPSDRRSARTTDRAADAEVLREEIERLRDELEAVERDVEGRTVRKEELKEELERYVRRRARRGHARGWGPYLVLLYGTAMSVGAFYFLQGGWSILAMLVVWTSTLGVYVLMVLFGAGISLLGIPGRVRDAVGSRRS